MGITLFTPTVIGAISYWRTVQILTNEHRGVSDGKLISRRHFIHYGIVAKKSHFLFDHRQGSAMDRYIELTGARRNSIVLIDRVGQWIWHRNGFVAGNTRYVFYLLPRVCEFLYCVLSVSVCKSIVTNFY